MSLLVALSLASTCVSASSWNMSAGAAQHCSARGGCDCDCSWASSSSCKDDDGSCCFGCCCAAPSPSPSPSPSPGPSPGVTEYCPETSEDFQAEVEGPPGTITWTPQGWHIQGQRRVSSKASFDLKAGSVEWDMDLSQSHGGVNSNMYVTFPHQANCGKACYCDSGATGGCAEMDYTENNGGCFQATTWHEDVSGGDKSGHGGTGGLSGGVVHMKATYSSDGNQLDMQIGGNHYSGHGIADQMSQYGAVIYSSQWVGWVPGNCGGDGNLQASSFSVSNLKITGRVVQGPEPRKCHSPPTAAPTSSPTSTPTLPPTPTPVPGPTRAPTSPTQGCPGGSMGACFRLCPSDEKGYKACAKDCDRRCQNEIVI